MTRERDRTVASFTSLASLAAALLITHDARAETRALRLDYRAHEGCPSGEGLVEEITWRTGRARVAAAGEPGLTVKARIDKRGARSVGRIVIGEGKEIITREIAGTSCDEVVSALGLVTALAIDPRAATGRKPPPPPPAPAPPPPPPRAPRPLPPAPPGLTAPPERVDPSALIAPPLPVVPSAAPSPPAWKFGARAVIAFGAAPRPLFGGGLAAERGIDPSLGAALRLSLEIAATGGFTIDPGGAAFLRAFARAEGCAFTWRPVRPLSLVPCISVEAGALRGEGIAGGAIRSVGVATVPWVAAGLLPALAIDLGGVVIEAQGGPVFPLIRRQFVFESPDALVHEVPAVTGTVGLGVGMTIP